MEKFPDYWDKDRVHIDRIIYRFVPDPSVRVANLKSGDLDIIEQVAPSDLGGIAADKRLRTTSVISLGYTRIYLNVGNGARANTPFGRDARLRQAFDLAIDRHAITQVVFDGEYVPATSWIPPESPYHLTSVPPQRRDIAKAKELLAAAGQPHPSIELMVFNNAVAIQVGQMIQRMAKDAGFDVKLLAMESVSALTAGEKGNFDAFLVGWPGYADPDANINNPLYCKAPLNYSGYCNSEFDRLLDLARASFVVSDRVKYYTLAREILAHDEPYIFLYHHKWIWAYGIKVNGFAAHPDGYTRIMDLSLN